MQSISVKKLPHFGDLELPKFETPGSAGMDLRAAVDTSVTLEPGERKMIPTGLAMAIPQGFAGIMCGRSGLATKSGIHPVPAPGVIDSDYRGELMVCLINLDKRNSFVINRGDRIGQFLILPVFQPQWREVEELDTTERGTGGHGSTGHK